MPHDKMIKKIKFELDQIDKLLYEYDDLIDKAVEGEIDSVELAAMASILHSFYNGIENIFLLIAKNIDGNVPKGSNWHKDLLAQMNEENNRDKVISENLQMELLEYLAFRHFYRHSYSFFLDWEEMEHLAVNIKRVKIDFSIEISEFIEDYS